MDDLLMKVGDFFRRRKTEAKIGPKIKISYEHWGLPWEDDIDKALREQWDALLKELPKSCIKDRSNNSFRTGYVQETLQVDIDGAIMEIEGPYIRDLTYRPPPTVEERRSPDEYVDDLIRQTTVTYVLSNCSSAKWHAFVDSITATRNSKKVNI